MAASMQERTGAGAPSAPVRGICMRISSNADKAINRRRERRYVLPTLAVYTEEGSDCREKLVNVSKTGCSFVTPVSLTRGEHVLLHFIASSNYYAIDDSYCLDGRVVWRSVLRDGNYRYGVQFPETHSDFLEGETRAFREQVDRLASRGPVPPSAGTSA
ncbi:MAG: hypothetical protein GF418_10325 [Chitinivibrionales bacterium]|nr:hypothetical protein [Chitinivibrionales bacterium]MBD3396009.1 hypothetical protein [Chitinivibrionales bacterium]